MGKTRDRRFASRTAQVHANLLVSWCNKIHAYSSPDYSYYPSSFPYGFTSPLFQEISTSCSNHLSAVDTDPCQCLPPPFAFLITINFQNNDSLLSSICSSSVLYQHSTSKADQRTRH